MIFTLTQSEIFLLLAELLSIGAVISLIYLFNFQYSFNLFFWSRFGVSEGAYFRGKTVWLVGCSSGIGENCARRLAGHGCQLILSARRESLLTGLKKECEGMRKETVAKVLPLDITQHHTFHDLCVKANDAFGTIDVVILCSGQSQRADWLTVKPEVDRACFEVNALGPTVLARTFISTLHADRQGQYPRTKFLVISSVGGLMPSPLSPSYTAAKHALMGYFRCMNMELSSRGISASMVCPALIFAPNNVLTALTDTIEKLNGEKLTEASPCHMLPQRAAQLILRSVANDIEESWISRDPIVMLLAYGYTVCPGITNRIVQSIGLHNLKKIRTGSWKLR